MMKKLLGVLTILALLLNIAIANNMAITKKGLRDFSTFLTYYVNKDICTKITVLNTNKTHSILAKVAIIEHTTPNKLDFPIFLNPGDIWSGKICQKDGNIILVSNDDSIHPMIAPILANEKNLDKSINIKNVNNKFSIGYIEILPVAEFKEGSEKKINNAVLVKRWKMFIDNKCSSNQIKTNMSKHSLDCKIEYESNKNIKSILPM